MNESKPITTVDATIDLHNAIKTIKNGEILLYPTDTVWGLGADIYNDAAIARIYEIKAYPRPEPMVLLVDSIERLSQYVYPIHPRIETLLTYHISPLTILYDNPRDIPDTLISDEGRVAIRLCKHPWCVSLIEAIDQPLLSTMAMRSGEPIPAQLSYISLDLQNEVSYIASSVELREAFVELPSVMASYNQEGDLIFIRN